MKNIKLLTIILAGLSAASCAFELPYPTVTPDPAFSVSGLQKYATISIYEETPVNLTITRTYGLSKEIAVDLAIDESKITEYNELYSASYELMDQQYYSFPPSVTFAPNTQKVTVPVVIKTSALVKAKGAKAVQSIIPIVIKSASMDIKDPGTMGSVMVGISTSEPTIEVAVPDSPEELSFLSIDPLDQTITVTAKSNFTTLDNSKVSVVMDASKVAEFNQANGTSYQTLPTACLEVKAPVFDKESLSFTNDVAFKSKGMEDGVEYVCPLVVRNTAGYVVSQSEPVYVIASLTELRAWATQGGNVISTDQKTASIEMQMNAPLSSDQTVSFKYDEAAVNAYNAANGTSYVPLGASNVTVTNGNIVAAARRANVTVSLNTSKLPYDGEDSYMVALSVDKSLFPAGTLFDESKTTVYLVVVKSIAGEYIKTVDGMTWAWDWKKGDVVTFTALNKDKGEHTENITSITANETGYNSFENKINLVKGSSYESWATQKYYIVYGGGWKDGIFLFDVSETPGADGLCELINLQDRQGDYDYICSKSTFNPETGTFVWQIAVPNGWGTVRELYCTLSK